MDVSLAQLRTLKELARLGTMAAVADVLGYTPGAISQQLAQLERSVGSELTVRIGRRVILTDSGTVLAQHATAILRAVDEAQAALEVASREPTGPVLLGTFTTAAATLLATVADTTARDFPRVELSSQELSVDDASAAVSRGEVDLAFGLDYSHAPIPREEGIDYLRLRSERFELALPAAMVETLIGSDGQGAPLDLASAASWNWILPPENTHYGLAARVACRLAGFEPRVVHEVLDTAASLALVSRGLGVTPVTDMMLELAPTTGLTRVRLVQDVYRHLILAKRRDGLHRPSVGAVADVITDVVQQIADSART